MVEADAVEADVVDDVSGSLNLAVLHVAFKIHFIHSEIFYMISN